ncbi:MAG: N-acetyltransferase [Phycisphaeraceae bacterium]|nr:N-acetyltransferase [Phycisphaeraceae bacterium]
MSGRSADGVRIRAGVAADVAGIFAIYDVEVLHGTATFETVPKTLEERAAWFAAFGAGAYPLLVAVAEGTVIGWAGLSAWSVRPAYRRTAECSVYMHQAWRGRGIGERLLREVLERARKGKAVRVVVARISQPNEASNRMHARLGFKDVGTLRRCGEKFGRVLDVLLMDVHLDEGHDA